MRSSRCLLLARLFMLLLAAALPLRAAAEEEFSPDLGQALELIDQGANSAPQIPADAPEMTAYPLPREFPQELLSELPRRPFRQVTPLPQATAWWKYPFYVGLGLPRDAVDGFVGVLANIPIFSIAIYGAYEVVPTQAFLRDPRDWHRWDGNQNHNGHGFYDGSSWGWFPSAHQWKFTYESKGKARRNTRYNEKLRRELNEKNRVIEAGNQQIASRIRTAREAALAAIEAGDGATATKHAFPAQEAYPSDEGLFALKVTALALHVDQGPAWVRPELYNDLTQAQPRMLEPAEKLLTRIAKKFPDHPGLHETLVYTRLVQSRDSDALAAAKAWQAAAPSDVRRARLLFEVALTAGDVAAAEASWAQLPATTFATAEEHQVAEARLALAKGEAAPARAQLTALQAAKPENAYYNYYLGALNLVDAQQAGGPAEAIEDVPQQFRAAFTQMETAALRAPTTALRLRAGQALGYVRGVVAGIAQEPELYKAQQDQSGPALMNQ